MTVIKKKLIFLLFILLLSSCATTEKDPHENFNRDMLELNIGIDKSVLKPIASGYKDVTSEGVRDSMTNFFDNFKEPYYFLNYLISFQPEKAASSLFRFVMNSTLGFLGFFDVARKTGLPKQTTDYKDTLQHIGVSPGNYFVLPILGSNSTNYVLGEPISWFADPMGYVIGLPYMALKALLSTINTRAETSQVMDDVINGPMDVYSITKNLYYQKYGEKKQTIKQNEEFTFEDFDEEE